MKDKAKHQVRGVNQLLKVKDYNKRIVLDDRNHRLKVLFVEFPLNDEPSYKVIDRYPKIEGDYFDNYYEVYHFLRGYKKQV